MNRPIYITWRDLLEGNHISDTELNELLKTVTETINSLEKFKDLRFHLVLSELRKEQECLNRYKTARENRNY